MRYKDTNGDDTLIGTSADDVFRMNHGGNDTVTGGGGFDRVEIDYRDALYVSGQITIDTDGTIHGYYQASIDDDVNFSDMDQLISVGGKQSDNVFVNVFGSPARPMLDIDGGAGNNYLFVGTYGPDSAVGKFLF